MVTPEQCDARFARLITAAPPSHIRKYLTGLSHFNTKTHKYVQEDACEAFGKMWRSSIKRQHQRQLMVKVQVAFECKKCKTKGSRVMEDWVWSIPGTGTFNCKNVHWTERPSCDRCKSDAAVTVTSTTAVEGGAFVLTKLPRVGDQGKSKRVFNLPNVLRIGGSEFKMKAVIRHVGTDAQQGHYVAWVSSKEREGYLINDETINAHQFVTTADDYMVLWERQGVGTTAVPEVLADTTDEQREVQLEVQLEEATTVPSTKTKPAAQTRTATQQGAKQGIDVQGASARRRAMAIDARTATRDAAMKEKRAETSASAKKAIPAKSPRMVKPTRSQEAVEAGSATAQSAPSGDSMNAAVSQPKLKPVGSVKSPRVVQPNKSQEGIVAKSAAAQSAPSGAKNEIMVNQPTQQDVVPPPPPILTDDELLQTPRPVHTPYEPETPSRSASNGSPSQNRSMSTPPPTPPEATPAGVSGRRPGAKSKRADRSNSMDGPKFRETFGMPPLQTTFWLKKGGTFFKTFMTAKGELRCDLHSTTKQHPETFYVDDEEAWVRFDAC